MGLNPNGPAIDTSSLNVGTQVVNTGSMPTTEAGVPNVGGMDAGSVPRRPMNARQRAMNRRPMPGSNPDLDAMSNGSPAGASMPLPNAAPPTSMPGPEMGPVINQDPAPRPPVQNQDLGAAVPRSQSQGAGYTEASTSNPQQGSTTATPQNNAEPPQDTGAGSGSGSLKELLNPTTIVAMVIILLVVVVFTAIIIHKKSGKKPAEEEEIQQVEDFSNWGAPADIPAQPTEETDQWQEVEDFDTLEPVGGSNDVWKYTAKQIERLRAAGYTGDEIEEAEHNIVPYEQLIAEAEQAKRDYIANDLAPLFDETTDEWKHWMKQTWFGLEPRDDMYEFSQGNYTQYSVTDNLDYEKIDVYGNQCFLKVYFDDNVHDYYFFMTVMPERWCELEDFGNIVITYKYICPYVINDDGSKTEDRSRMFVISAAEERVE